MEKDMDMCADDHTRPLISKQAIRHKFLHCSFFLLTVMDPLATSSMLTTNQLLMEAAQLFPNVYSGDWAKLRSVHQEHFPVGPGVNLCNVCSGRN